MNMNNFPLIHYYFGEREQAYHAGLGIIVRASGHGKKCTIIFINDSFSWKPQFEQNRIRYNIIESQESEYKMAEILFEIFNELENTVCLISNFDLFLYYFRLNLLEKNKA